MLQNGKDILKDRLTFIWIMLLDLLTNGEESISNIFYPLPVIFHVQDKILISRLINNNKLEVIDHRAKKTPALLINTGI